MLIKLTMSLASVLKFVVWTQVVGCKIVYAAAFREIFLAIDTTIYTTGVDSMPRERN